VATAAEVRKFAETHRDLLTYGPGSTAASATPSPGLGRGTRLGREDAADRFLDKAHHVAREPDRRRGRAAARVGATREGEMQGRAATGRDTAGAQTVPVGVSPHRRGGDLGRCTTESVCFVSRRANRSRDLRDVMVTPITEIAPAVAGNSYRQSMTTIMDLASRPVLAGCGCRKGYW
jgi:hypothetical protein